MYHYHHAQYRFVVAASRWGRAPLLLVGGNRGSGDIPLPGAPANALTGWQLYTTACSRRRHRTTAHARGHCECSPPHPLPICRLHCRRRDAIPYLCAYNAPEPYPRSPTIVVPFVYPRAKLFTAPAMVYIHIIYYNTRICLAVHLFIVIYFFSVLIINIAFNRNTKPVCAANKRPDDGRTYKVSCSVIHDGK